jgi:hypothetical protein
MKILILFIFTVEWLWQKQTFKTHTQVHHRKKVLCKKGYIQKIWLKEERDERRRKRMKFIFSEFLMALRDRNED